MYRYFGVNPVNLIKPVVEIDLDYGIVKKDPFYWVREVASVCRTAWRLD